MQPSPGGGARSFQSRLLPSAGLRVVLLAIIILSSPQNSCKAAAGGGTAAGPASGHQVEVASVQELRHALRDERVMQVSMLPSGSWNLSRHAWGSEALTLHRAVLLEGIPSPDGQPPHVDANQLAQLVVVGKNGSLHLRSLFLDDCLLPGMPLLCLAAGADGGTLRLDQLVLGDSSCTSIRHSAATNWLLKSAYTAAWKSSWSQVDAHSVHVADTGAVLSASEGVLWRILNSTFRCTATNNGTPLLSSIKSNHSEVQMALSVLATAVMLLAGLHWLMNQGAVYAKKDESVEEAAARAIGIKLLGVIGKGICGNVYRARYEGQTLAVKITSFTDANGQAAAQVANECRHAMACCHPCITSCLGHSTVTVRADASRRGCLQSNRFTPVSLGQPALGQRQQDEQRQQRWLLQCQHEQQQGAGRLAGCDAVLDAASQPDRQPPAAAVRSAQAATGTTDVDTGPSSSGLRASSCMSDCLVSLLVMEHCPLGNLHQAITAGRFHNRQSGQPKWDWVLRTALDLALALEHLHTKCNIMHRDVSTNNILLTPDTSDVRGFRAVLGDFGLSTKVVGAQAYTTSQLKGTVHFMPPEVFTSGEFSYSTDVYSHGIALYWMVKREGPYADLVPFEVVGKKLEEAYRRQRLELPPSMPPELQAMVWECTHWDPRQRPTAEVVAQRLAGLICKLAHYGGKALYEGRGA